MPAVHDRGGWPGAGPIDRRPHELVDWERRTDAVRQVLADRGLLTTDELRRAIESLPQEQYESLVYYEKWTAALEILLTERGILSRDEIDRQVAAQPG